MGCGDQLKDEDPCGIRPVALNASEAGLHLVSTVGEAGASCHIPQMKPERCSIACTPSSDSKQKATP